MSDYIISACAPADLTKEQFEAMDVKYIYFHYSINGEMYDDDMGQTKSYKEFYDAMRAGADTATSQINPDEYIEFFSKYLEEGKDIIHLTLASGISGTYNSAMVAKGELEEKYPDRKIIIIDSTAGSVGYGMLMHEMSDKRAAGMNIDELAAWVEENKIRIQHWVMVSDLKWLVKGGRVSKTSGALGSLLNICPIIELNSEGKLIPRAKVRTVKKAMASLIDLMVSNADNSTEYDGKCYIGMTDCPTEAEIFKGMVEEKFPKLKDKIIINDIGTTIGSHVGPGTLVLVFWGKARTE